MSLATARKSFQDEEKGFSLRKRAAVLKAERDARIACLQGGDEWSSHGTNLKWIAATLYDIDEQLSNKRAP